MSGFAVGRCRTLAGELSLDDEWVLVVRLPFRCLLARGGAWPSSFCGERS